MSRVVEDSNRRMLRARDAMDREDLEKRELIMMRCLAHDTYDVVSQAQGTENMRIFVVQLRRKNVSQVANLQVVPGPRGRWYVWAVENIKDFNEFCRK